MLTLELNGEEISGEAYLRAARSFLHLIEQVADEIAHAKGAIETTVRVSEGSNRLHVTSTNSVETGPPIEIIEQSIVDGLRLMERVDERPQNFNNAAIANIRMLASVLHDERLPIDSITVVNGRDRTRITARSEAAANALLRADYQDYGTVEGRLQIIAERKRTRLYVFDSLTDRKISCRIVPELRQQALDFFGKRIEASGLIRYRSDGEPISIQTTALELIDSDQPLPMARDVLGILKGGA